MSSGLITLSSPLQQWQMSRLQQSFHVQQPYPGELRIQDLPRDRAEIYRAIASLETILRSMNVAIED